MTPSSPSAPSPTNPSAWLAVASGLGAGVLVALMVRLNATLGTHIGVLESSFAVHVAGTIFSTVLILPGIARLGRRIAEPSLALFSGGALGVFIVLVANVLVPVLGIALTLSLSVVANLVFSTVADHFGWLGLPVIRVTWQRVAGLLLAVVGVVLVAFG